MTDRIKICWTQFPDGKEKHFEAEFCSVVKIVSCSEIQEMIYEDIERYHGEQYLSIPKEGFGSKDITPFKSIEVEFENGRTRNIAFNGVAFLENGEGKTIRIHRVVSQ